MINWYLLKLVQEWHFACLLIKFYNTCNGIIILLNSEIFLFKMITYRHMWQHNCQFDVASPYFKRFRVFFFQWLGRNVWGNTSSKFTFRLQQMAHLPGYTATSWWWYPTVLTLSIYANVLLLHSILKYDTSNSRQFEDTNNFNLWYLLKKTCSLSPLSLSSICPSFSLSLSGVSTLHKVPDGKQTMV